MIGSVRIAVRKETAEDERRVALVPDTVQKLVDDEHEVVIESGAGGDFYPDEAYTKAGARIAEKDALADADVVLQVQAPAEDELEGLPENALLICFLDPSAQEDTLKRLAQRRITVFSMAVIPRTGAAQAMDAISSMSSVAGYQAVLMAAQAAGRYLPMMTTAAGTTKAAKVLVLGVGVAGLQAIATARRLGAEVEAFDIRPEVADQVRSLGATFIEARDEDDADDPAGESEPAGPQIGRTEAFVKALLGLPPELGHRSRGKRSQAGGGAGGSGGEDSSDEEKTQDQARGGYASEQAEEKQRRDQELMTERLGEMDVVLTTALIPGKPAPTLVTTDMVERMKPGAVLFDLAVEAGGNCELSEPGEVVTHGHVRIHGPLNLPSTMPMHASHLLSRNMAAVLSHLIGEDGELQLDFDDEITAGAVLAHDGEVRDR
ncbi:MAG: NAD(P) transhydrogenase subunit alpha [Solirubrobacteraceae bacterium]